MKAHQKSTLSPLLFCCLLAFPAPSAAGQRKKGAPKLRDDVELPAEYTLDFQLGASARSSIRGSNALILGTPLNQAGARVFQDLISSGSIRALGRPYQWNLSVLDNGVLNAESAPDGGVFVHGRLARLIGTDQGLWAAVLSHEIEHVAQRHWVKKYLYSIYVAQQIQYWQARARAGDKSAIWGLVGIRIAAPIAEARLSRNLEHDADIQGMRLMAEAGYHPDYVFALHHMLLMQVPDQSHLAAFFSNHPRWETRDQRDDKAYADALSEFERRWPDAALSPGGLPPAVAFPGRPSETEDKQTSTADLQFPVYCRNATKPLVLAIWFKKDRAFVHSNDPAFTDSKGNLFMRRDFTCAAKEQATVVDVRLAATLVSKDDRKLKAETVVMTDSGDPVAQFREFGVHFPAQEAKTPAPEIRAPESASTGKVAARPLAQATTGREAPSLGVTGDATEDGLTITSVQPGSPAQQAGLNPGDVIAKIDDRPVRSGADVESAISASTTGWVKVTYWIQRGWLSEREIKVR